ncbi:unnamed protein product [Camellia sinensis]
MIDLKTMANSFVTVTFFVSAFCVFSLVGAARYRPPHFFVEGQVYCDTCRTQFVTKVSQLMTGAKVRLECTQRDGGKLTFSAEAETDGSGTYQLPVEGDHEDDECEVVLVKSSKPECEEIDKDGWGRTSAKISLTANNGMSTSVRKANPLGFLKKEALPECPQVLKELTIQPEGV